MHTIKTLIYKLIFNCKINIKDLRIILQFLSVNYLSDIIYIIKYKKNKFLLYKINFINISYDKFIFINRLQCPYMKKMHNIIIIL